MCMEKTIPQLASTLDTYCTRTKQQKYLRTTVNYRITALLHSLTAQYVRVTEICHINISYMLAGLQPILFSGTEGKFVIRI